MGGRSRPWWTSAVVYQIYPRSFADSDGDGIGDLRGILEHLDHVCDLGIDVVWLSPVYRSPQDDNGYDISDYYDVDPLFGTLDDLDEVITALGARSIRLVMDLVVNHTSDEHPWFVDSRSSRTAEKADWYIWRDPKPGTTGGTSGAEPNNWGSFFSGSVWEWVPEREQYYLHLFSPKQPDLNWENPEVRTAVFDMMRWWLDRGVGGFRMDVINLISKDPALPDGKLREDGLGDGTPYFSSGPRLHEFLADMKREVFDPHQEALLTVGEMPGVSAEDALRFTDEEQVAVERSEHFAMHLGEELVHPRAVDDRSTEAAVLLAGPDLSVRERRVLGDQVDDVHPEAVDAPVEPPAHHRVDGLADLGVLPVEVGLLAREEVQVVLAGHLVVLPRRAGEERSPVVRLGSRLPRYAALTSGPPPVPVALGIVRGRPRLDEPRVLVGGVVDHEVHQQLHAAPMDVGQQLVEVLESAEQRVDVLVVADVVAVVVHRRAVDRRQPDDVDTELLEVVEVLPDADEVADPVTGRVGEAARVDLVDDGRAPPR